MKISLNGETVEIGKAATLADLVTRFELPPESIVIEHNGIALHRRDWPRQGLGEGDRVEFVRVVAGG